MHDYAAAESESYTGKRRMLYLCFYLQFCGEEKGSAEIKEGRVTSHVEHQRETVKSGDKPFLLETEPLLQPTQPCKELTIMQDDGGVGEASMEHMSNTITCRLLSGGGVLFEAKRVPITGLKITKNKMESKTEACYCGIMRELPAQCTLLHWIFDIKLLHK